MRASDKESERDIRLCDAFWTVRVQRHGIWIKERTSKIPVAHQPDHQLT